MDSAKEMKSGLEGLINDYDNIVKMTVTENAPLAKYGILSVVVVVVIVCLLLCIEGVTRSFKGKESILLMYVRMSEGNLLRSNWRSEAVVQCMLPFHWRISRTLQANSLNCMTSIIIPKIMIHHLVCAR